ncbi:hypothetical protein A9Q88_12395 [Gammaproteobacteria bacterium 50_400_T64]|nr:hypothetical protein A9Q88_12395 [Gammaproteobacteria bacterium 50_400_T64]
MSIISVLNSFFYKRLSGFVPLVVATVLLASFEATGASAAEGEAPSSKASSNQAPSTKEASFRTVEWLDLMPKDDLEVLLNPPQSITDIEDGSLEDGSFEDQISNQIAAASDDRYQQALVSTRVVAEMDGKAIRLPGFVVPLEHNDDQAITQFFLVPYFGACIHMPPPPPNQIVLVNYPQGIKFTSINEPIWVSGVVKTSIQQNDLATAAYVMELAQFEAYSE